MVNAGTILTLCDPVARPRNDFEKWSVSNWVVIELTYRPSLINEVANFTNGVVHVARTTSRRLAIGPYFWRTNANARIGERSTFINHSSIVIRNIGA
ncbi:hypothetical protein Moror_12003 [Moniliophthora roreri MCA 2997]|uniref:Uncharacterized protein n=1 Tax=Moniliophthora roreri (strain MCA 2997) TaxID=1381753 RepID=V2WJH4_MONRO|nr:hypothetical protein Moror_12003 [Moniliophthora roreri MCA 2997]